jgi:uncharacterized membrane protein HdeD (DUF308 family)
MTATEAEQRLATHWAWVVFRGIVAVLFGLLSFAQPAPASLMLVLVFGAYAFTGGVVAVATALRRDRRGRRDVLLLDGVVGVGLSAFSLSWPARPPLAVVCVVGAWAIATGAMELTNALRLRRALEREWSLALAGVVSIAFGLYVLIRPFAGGGGRGLAVMWSVGAWALAFGALTIALGLRLHSFCVHAHGRGRQMPRLYLAR